MFRVLLDTPPSRGMRARQNLGGRFTFAPPRCGTACVCCNADAAGRTRTYNPSADRTRATSFPVPVCEVCDAHALRSPVARTWQGALWFVGIAVAIGALIAHHDHPTIPLAPLVAGGAGLAAIGVAWWAWSAWTARGKGAHHPWMVVTLDSGVPIVTTGNPQLVERLLANHRDARLRGARPPSARALR